MTAALRLTEEELPLACPRDGVAMTLVRVSPKVGAMPELRTYRCERCGAVETVEVRPRVSAAKSWHRAASGR